MNKNIFTMAAMMLLPLSAFAQETYEIANIATQDLNGTARYIGMGGALEALGADISTISTNPAGIGLFRKNQVTASLGLVSQAGEKSFSSSNKTNVSFDQIGFVAAFPGANNSYLNFGVNYHKSRNFCQILSVTDRLDGASQSKLTYDKFKWGVIRTADDYAYNQVDVLYHEGLYDTYLIDEDGNFNQQAERMSGDSFDFTSGNHGYIGEYSLNISGNINNRVYLGLTVDIDDVNYRGHSIYKEYVSHNNAGLETAMLEDHRDIDGTGVAVKLGTIFRPMEDSPFRVGLFLHSPTFYSLTSYNHTNLFLNGKEYDGSPRSGELKYLFYTPWKFGVSLGHTIGSQLALGATYEYADYGSTDARIKDNGWYDNYDDSESDDAMNAHIKETLKGVSTVKLGVEYKPDPALAIRFGYNYVSPMYQKDASRGVDIQSLGNYYSSTTEYINWKDTHRITVGLGFSLSPYVKLDVAYQYRTQKGQFLPFAGSDDDNLPFDKDVKNNRHQWLATLAYSF